jgi:GAF domain-containing protein/HAMP domain-containing protein
MAIKNSTYEIAAEKALQAQNAYRIALIGVIASGIAIPFYAYMAYQTKAWQLFALVLNTTLLFAAALATLRLVRKGKPRSLWILILAAQLTFVSAAALITGLGWISLIGIGLLTVVVAALALPSRQSLIAIFLALANGSLAVLLDWLKPGYRYPAPPQIQYFLPGLVIAVLLFYTYFLVRRYRKFSFRGQIITAFILVSFVSIGTVALFTIQTTQRVLSQSANEKLSAAASQTAVRLDTFFNTNLIAIRVEAELPEWSEFLKIPPDQRASSELYNEVFATLSTLGRKDTEFISSYALIDSQGIDVVDTYKQDSGMSKSDRDYVQRVLQTGQPYLSPVEFSRATEEGALYFSAPVRNEAGEIAGVLRARYKADILQQFISQNNNMAGPGSYAVLVDENHVRLAHGLAPDLIFKSIAPIDRILMIRLQSERRLPKLPIEDLSTDLPALEQALNQESAQSVFVGEVSESTGSNNPNPSVEQAVIVGLSAQPWKLIFAQDRSILLAPVEAQTRNILILAVVIAGVVALIGLGLAQILSAPIIQLTDVAEKVTAGDLTVHAPVESGRETSTLARTFNSMTEQLRGTLEKLEQRVAERTSDLERRSVQLQTAAEVGSAVASIRDLNELLQQVTRLVSQRFDFYHTGIFLLDTVNQEAVLMAANSEGGQRMLARGHRLKIGEKGIVGYVTGNKEPRIALDVGQDAVYFDNPDLPETRSEMALPLIAGGQILGALDVQSRMEEAFSEEDIAVLQIVADQVAVAIENARLFTENQTALEAARRAYGEMSREAWDNILRSNPDLGYICTLQDMLYPASAEWKPELIQASQTGETVAAETNTLAIPIKIRDQVTGVIRLRKPEGEKKWTDDEIELMETLTEQLSVALESARLYQDTQRRAERERLASQITANIRTSNDPQTILQTAVKELRQALQANKAQVSFHASQPAKPSSPEKGNGHNGPQE